MQTYQQHIHSESTQNNEESTGKKGLCLPDHRGLSNPVQRKTNKTGLPDNLKSGIENLSGIALDDVKVHYNSSAPAQLNAHAYAQGTNIHVAPGQEKHLPHEAWHVVQQKQGRVKPTTQLKGKVNVNDDAGLEKEADVMGAKAMRHTSGTGSVTQRMQSGGSDVVQRAIIVSEIKYSSAAGKADKAKMQQVKAYLNTSLATIDNGIRDIKIDVNERSILDPARTSLTNKDQTISIVLGVEFLKISSVGDIVGMLTHEIGVHTLADKQQSWGDKSEEEHYEKHPFTVKVGLHKHTISPWDDKRKWGGRQKDHVNVARDKGQHDQPRRSIKGQPQYDVKGKSLKGTAFDEDSVNRRAEEYAETMLRLGDAISKDLKIKKPEREKRLHDLLNSFLFDYARMIATDDVALHVADKTPLVAQVFNWYKNVIIARHAAAHPWLNNKNMLPTASTWGLRAYLLGKLTQALSAKFLPTKVHNTVGSVLSTGGKVISGIGGAITSRTPQVIRRGVGAIAGGTGKVLRAADYVYGETENVVRNTVAVGANVVKGTVGLGASAVKGTWNFGKRLLGY